MKVEIKKNGNKTIAIKAESAFEWEVVKGIIAMTDPISLTTHMQDKGFVTDGNDVVDILDLLERKMEE